MEITASGEIAKKRTVQRAIHTQATIYSVGETIGIVERVKMPQGKFVVHGSLSGLNEIINAARYNRFAGASQKKKETQRCALAVIAGGVSTFQGPVTVTFVWFEKDLRRDPDNICAGAKFILDALVELGRLPGDGRRWVKGISHVFPPPDKLAPRIEVELKLWV